MPMHWNDAADAKLFAAVLATGEVKLKYTELADWMGDECTAKAIQHRISTVRKVTKDTVTSEAKTTQPKSGVKRKAAKDDGNAEGEENENGEETPSKAKKPRAPRKKAAPKNPKKVNVDATAAEDVNDFKEEDAMDEESEDPVVVEDAGIVAGDD